MVGVDGANDLKRGFGLERGAEARARRGWRHHLSL
jgi:hypothetical protein